MGGYHSAAAIELAELQESNPSAYRERIRKALEQAAGSVPRAAESLGISGKTLLRRISEDKSLARGIELAGKGWPKGKPRKPHSATKKK